MAKDLRSMFATTQAAKWLVFDPTDEESSPAFQCKHFDVSSVDFQKVRAEVTKPYRKLVNNPAFMTPEKDREVMVRCFVKMSLRGWRNVYDGEDAVAFSEEAAVRYLLELPKLYVWLASSSTDEDTYRENLENMTKN